MVSKQLHPFQLNRIRKKNKGREEREGRKGERRGKEERKGERERKERGWGGGREGGKKGEMVGRRDRG